MVVIIMFVFMCPKSVSKFMLVSDKAQFGHNLDIWCDVLHAHMTF